MRSPLRGPLSVLILAVWMTPTLGALGVGLHLALDHHITDHATDHAEHGDELADLLRAAEHGHHHESGVTDHRHRARVERSVRPARAADVPSAELHSAIRLSSLSSEPAGGERFDRRGPPTPLLAAHASLLL